VVRKWLLWDNLISQLGTVLFTFFISVLFLILVMPKKMFLFNLTIMFSHVLWNWLLWSPLVPSCPPCYLQFLLGMKYQSDCPLFLNSRNMPYNHVSIEEVGAVQWYWIWIHFSGCWLAWVVMGVNSTSLNLWDTYLYDSWQVKQRLLALNR
jgi:hypothetical protein